MAKKMEALGMIETRGLVGLIEACDASLKAANVEMRGWRQVGGGLVTGFLVGDVAAVKAAIDAGADTASHLGEVVSAHVIARPDEAIQKVIPTQKSTGK